MDTIVVALDRSLVDGHLKPIGEAFGHVHVCADRAEFRREAARLGEDVVAMMIGAKEVVDADLLRDLPRLRVVGTLSTGTDHLDLDALAERHVEVIDAKGLNAVAVAEHALLLILASLKDLVQANEASWSGADRAGLAQLPGQLSGRSVGLLGAGATAGALVRLVQPFGCPISAWTRNPSQHADLKDLGVRFDTWEAVVAQSDVVSIHVALSSDTRSRFGAADVMALRQGAVLVNTSRLDIFDLDAVKTSLAAREDLRLAVDAAGVQHEFGTGWHGRVLASPHIAGVTREVAPKMRDHVIERMAAFWRSGQP